MSDKKIVSVNVERIAPDSNSVMELFMPTNTHKAIVVTEDGAVTEASGSNAKLACQKASDIAVHGTQLMHWFD